MYSPSPRGCDRKDRQDRRQERYDAYRKLQRHGSNMTHTERTAGPSLGEKATTPYHRRYSKQPVTNVTTEGTEGTEYCPASLKQDNTFTWSRIIEEARPHARMYMDPQPGYYLCTTHTPGHHATTQNDTGIPFLERSIPCHTSIPDPTFRIMHRGDSSPPLPKEEGCLKTDGLSFYEGTRARSRPQEKNLYT